MQLQDRSSFNKANDVPGLQTVANKPEGWCTVAAFGHLIELYFHADRAYDPYMLDIFVKI